MKVDRNRIPLGIAGLAVSTLLYYALPWHASTLLAGVVGVPFLVAYTWFLPGMALARLLPERGLDALEATARRFFLGLFFLLALAFVWALSGISVTTFSRALPIAVVLVCAMGLRRRRTASFAPVAALPRRDTVFAAGFGALVAIVFVCVLASGPPIDYKKDTLDHVAYVNEIASTGQPFPTTAFYRSPGANGADIRKGLLHCVYGFYRSYLGIETLVLFRWLGALLASLLALAVYATGSRLLGGRGPAALAGVLFLIGFDGGISSELARAGFYPNRFGLAFLLMFLCAALSFVERPRPQKLVEAALFAFSAAAVHVQYAVFAGLAIAIITVWKTCFQTQSIRSHLSRSIMLGVSTLAGLVPYALFRYLTAYQVNRLHSQVQGTVFLTDGWFIASPIDAWHSMGPIGVAALFAIVPLWRARQSKSIVGYSIAAGLSVVLIQLNPLVLPIVYKAISYVALRLDRIWPFYFLAAFYLTDYFRVRKPAEPRRRLENTVMALLLIASFAEVGDVVRHPAFAPSRLAAERKVSHYQWAAGLERLNKIEGTAVIASDPITSYTIAALTHHKVVCTYDQHAPPNDLLALERSTASRDILSPFTSASDKAALMREFGVTHVVINENLTDENTTDYWSIGPESARLARDWLLGMPGLFRVVSDEDGFLILAWTGASPPPVSSMVVPMLTARVPRDATKIGKVAGLAVIEAASIDTAKVYSAGDTIDVSLYWRRDRKVEIDRFMVSVRFDHTDPGLPFGGWPFPKLSRKFKEKLTGAAFRFRDDHNIESGFYDPDVWPDRFYVMDHASVPVPEHAAPGRYTVRVKLLTRHTAPTHRLRDFFYDDDRLSGVEVGEVTIGRR